MMRNSVPHIDILQRNLERWQPFHQFPVNYIPQYSPTNMLPQISHRPRRYQFQDFQYFVVIDFEATCDKDRIPNPQEIIEFPSVLVSSITGEIVSSFQTYVRPTCNPQLTEFCKELTGIQQNQVDGGISLSEALFRHDKWLEYNGVKHTNFAVVTWTDWDCEVMLESECRNKKIPKPHYFNQWINLKVPFGKVFDVSRFNLKQAVEKAGLTWEGRAHYGLDDAKNTARVLSLLMHKGFKFAITSKLPYEASKEAIPSFPSRSFPPHFRRLQEIQVRQGGHHFHCGPLCGVGTVTQRPFFFINIQQPPYLFHIV